MKRSFSPAEAGAKKQETTKASSDAETELKTTVPMTDDMFDFDKRFEPTPLGHSRLAQYVCRRLPEDYMIKDRDLKWLDECSSFLKGEPTNESVTAATEDALICNPGGHIDPFELLIDAKICDTHCKPLPAGK